MTTRITNAILADIGKVITSRDSELGFRIELLIHVGDIETIRPYSIDIMSVERDFLSSNFDKIEIKADVPLGTFNHLIYPNRDIIEATLTLTYSALTNSDIIEDHKPLTRRYKVTLPSIINEQANANDRIFSNREEGDLLGQQNATFILTDKAKDELLHTTASTIPRRTTAINAVKSILTSVFNKTSLTIENGLSGVSEAPGASKDIHECIVIPQMLEVLAIPRYVQEIETGIYPGGVNIYIQDNIGYIYPPYDTDQVSKGAETLTILNIPPDVYPAAEATWVEYEGNYIVLSTDDSMVVDTSEIEQGSLGSGTHYLNADAYLRPVGYKHDDNGIYLNSNNNFVQSYIESKRNKFNFTTRGTKPITANHMHENSQLAARNGAIGRISWENAKIGIVKPGMAVRLLTLKNDRVNEYHGVVHRILHSVVPKTQDRFNQFFVSNAKLDVFITPDPVNVYDLD